MGEIVDIEEEFQRSKWGWRCFWW